MNLSVTATHLRDRGEPKDTPVGLSDIAERLSVAPQSAQNWRTRGVLPEARWMVGGRPVWSWEYDIEPWAIATGRLVVADEDNYLLPDPVWAWRLRTPLAIRRNLPTYPVEMTDVPTTLAHLHIGTLVRANATDRPWRGVVRSIDGDQVTVEHIAGPEPAGYTRVYRPSELDVYGAVDVPNISLDTLLAKAQDQLRFVGLDPEESDRDLVWRRALAEHVEIVGYDVPRVREDVLPKHSRATGMLAQAAHTLVSEPLRSVFEVSQLEEYRRRNLALLLLHAHRDGLAAAAHAARESLPR